jgi:uncharacterized protein
MTFDEAIDALKGCEDDARARGVTALYLFGSVAAGTADDRSDVDLFVDYDPGSDFTAFRLAALKQAFEERLHRPVDLTTRRALHPAFRQRIEQSSRRVF